MVSESLFLAGRCCLFYLPGPFSGNTDVIYDVMYLRTVSIFKGKLWGCVPVTVS